MDITTVMIKLNKKLILQWHRLFHNIGKIFVTFSMLYTLNVILFFSASDRIVFVQALTRNAWRSKTFKTLRLV